MRERLDNKIVHGSLPLAAVAAHTLMDEKGNLLPAIQPRSSKHIPKGWSDQRVWNRVIESMVRDIPRTYGGHRHGLEPVTMEQIGHKRRVDGLLGRMFAVPVADRLAA